MKFYYVVSGWWRTGLIIARSSLHAIAVAKDTGLHKTGRSVHVWEVSDITLRPSTLRLLPCGPGRVLPASLLRREALLIKKGE